MKNYKTNFYKPTLFFVNAFFISIISNAQATDIGNSVSESLTTNENYIEIYIDPSIERLGWESPKELAKSYLKASVRQSFSDQFPLREGFQKYSKSTVGHAVIKFECRDSNNEKYLVYTGMSGEEDTSESLDDLVNKKMGFGVLFKSYDDGYVESGPESRNLIAHHFGRYEVDEDGNKTRMKPLRMKFNINTQQCDQIVDVFKTFKFQAFREPKENRKKLQPKEKVYFGLTEDAYQSYLNKKSDPDNTVMGGICTSYAVAFLKAANLYESIFEKMFRRDIIASVNLLGERDPQTGKNYEIPFMDLMSDKYTSWITPGYPTKKLSFYEPELLWKFMNGAASCLNFINQKAQSNQAIEPNESLPRNCSPELLNWVQQNQSRLKTGSSIVAGNFEEKEYIRDNRGTRTQIKTKFKKKYIQINGIDILN